MTEQRHAMPAEVKFSQWLSWPALAHDRSFGLFWLSLICLSSFSCLWSITSTALGSGQSCIFAFQDLYDYLDTPNINPQHDDYGIMMSQLHNSMRLHKNDRREGVSCMKWFHLLKRHTALIKIFATLANQDLEIKCFILNRLPRLSWI